MIHEISEDSHETHAVWADGERTAAGHRDSGEFITSWAARWGFRDTLSAMSAMAEVQEELSAHNGSESHAAAVKAQKFYRQVFMAVLSFKGPTRFAMYCACLALGWKDIIGCQTQIAVGKLFKCSKANVEKCVGGIQQMCGIPETTDQRDRDARRHMRESRENQLKIQNVKFKNGERGALTTDGRG